jgi:hypothetical protein
MHTNPSFQSTARFQFDVLTTVVFFFAFQFFSPRLLSGGTARAPAARTHTRRQRVFQSRAMDPQLAAIMAKRKKQSDEDAQDGEAEEAIGRGCSGRSQQRTSPRATPPARAPAVLSTPPKRQPPTLPPTPKDSGVYPHRARASAGKEAGERKEEKKEEEAGEIAQAGRQGPGGGEHGAQAKQAGVGMTLTERHPFKVVSLRPGGPAAAAGQIEEGDELTCVQGEVLGPHVSGAQVWLHARTHAWRHTHTAHPSSAAGFV